MKISGKLSFMNFLALFNGCVLIGLLANFAIFCKHGHESVAVRVPPPTVTQVQKMIESKSTACRRLHDPVLCLSVRDRLPQLSHIGYILVCFSDALYGFDPNSHICRIAPIGSKCGKFPRPQRA